MLAYVRWKSGATGTPQLAFGDRLLYGDLQIRNELRPAIERCLDESCECVEVPFNLIPAYRPLRVLSMIPPAGAQDLTPPVDGVTVQLGGEVQLKALQGQVELRAEIIDQELERVNTKVEQLLRESGLRHFFDAVVDSHVVGYAKPDPRIFKHALDITGSEPSRTLHVGDMYYADIVGAEAAGIRAVLLDPFDDWADYDCPRLPDLPALHQEMSSAIG